MNNIILKINDISKSYGKTQALDKINCQIEKGEFIVLLGAAGAGKTTLLRTISGLENPDTGIVNLLGVDVTNMQPKDRNVAMILDSLALYPNKSGFDNIAHPLHVQKINKETINKQVDEVATILKIHHILNRLPSTMSGGERQRIALGRALVRDPSIFMLDEPLSSLDAKLRIELRVELRRLQREHNHTFLLATPDYLEALSIADKVIMLVDGEVRQIASAQELYDNPNDRDIAEFVGSPKINLIDASCDINHNRIKIGDDLILLPQKFIDAFNGESEKFQLGIRPEDIIITEEGEVELTIVDIEPLGIKSVVLLENDIYKLRVTMPTSEAKLLKPASIKSVSFRVDNMHAYNVENGLRIA